MVLEAGKFMIKAPSRLCVCWRPASQFKDSPLLAWQKGWESSLGSLLSQSHGLHAHDLITLPKVSSLSTTTLGVKFQQTNLVGRGGHSMQTRADWEWTVCAEPVRAHQLEEATLIISFCRWASWDPNESFIQNCSERQSLDHTPKLVESRADAGNHCGIVTVS